MGLVIEMKPPTKTFLVEDEYGSYSIKAVDGKQASELHVRNSYNLGPYEQMEVTVDGKPFTVFTYPVVQKRR